MSDCYSELALVPANDCEIKSLNDCPTVYAPSVIGAQAGSFVKYCMPELSPCEWGTGPGITLVISLWSLINQKVIKTTKQLSQGGEIMQGGPTKASGRCEASRLWTGLEAIPPILLKVGLLGLTNVAAAILKAAPNSEIALYLPETLARSCLGCLFPNDCAYSLSACDGGTDVIPFGDFHHHRESGRIHWERLSVVALITGEGDTISTSMIRDKEHLYLRICVDRDTCCGRPCDFVYGWLFIYHDDARVCHSTSTKGLSTTWNGWRKCDWERCREQKRDRIAVLPITRHAVVVSIPHQACLGFGPVTRVY